MSNNDKSKVATTIYGIKANQVSAEVLAVGENARASKTTLGSSEQGNLHAAMIQLQEALKSLNLQPQVKVTIDKEVEALRDETSADEVKVERAGSIMRNLYGKLKTAGIVVSEVVALAEPLQKIAAIVRIPLHYLGL